MPNREICILGGTGFLGSRLVSRLAESGHPVRVASRNIARHRHLKVLPTVRTFTCDIQDMDALQRLVDGCSLVINLVGILNEKGRDGAGFRAAHTDLAAKLVEACRLGQVDKLVQISALKADASSGPSHYLRTKGEAETIIKERCGDLAWTILQPSVIFGPGDAFINRFAELLRRFPGVFPLAKPDALFAPVHVADVVLAIRKVMFDDNSNGITYQLYGAEVYSLREILRQICEALGIRRYILGLPDWLARAQAMAMELVPGKPFSMDNFRSLSVPSVGTEDGLKMLGIEPRSFELNLSSCIDQIRSRTAHDKHRRSAGRQSA